MPATGIRHGLNGSGCILLDEADSITNGLDGFSCIVWNLNSELFFKCHHQLNGIKAVCAEIVDKAGLLCHFVSVYAEVLYDNLFDPISNITPFNITLVKLIRRSRLPRTLREPNPVQKNSSG